LIGPRAVGIEAILIDRNGDIRNTEGRSIKNLRELALQF